MNEQDEKIEFLTSLAHQQLRSCTMLDQAEKQNTKCSNIARYGPGVKFERGADKVITLACVSQQEKSNKGL